MKLLPRIAFAACTLAAGMGLLSCEQKKTLKLFSWTYYTPTDVVKEFEQEFNCKVLVTEYDSNETMFNKLVNGGAKSFDIVVPSQDYVSIMMKRGMFQPLIQSKFTNRNKINPKVLEKITYDPDMIYAVPYYFGAAGIGVNKKKVPAGDYERTWNIFADPRFKGHASMMDDYREVIGDALKYKGYNVSTSNEREVSEAVNMIREKWLPNIVKFDAEGFGKDFARGDLWLCHGYAEVIYGEVPESEWESTIDFFIPEEGGASYLDSMCILKDSKNAELATEFINFIHRPENYAKFLDFFNFPCFVNLEAQKYMKSTPLYPASAMDKCQLKDDLGDNLDIYYKKWESLRLQVN
ncbi:extracellular solute-binding protein [Treponema sp.]|uniref:extracellular solute-binding protein n=1 Tax=Treponema sp. TaxID=166 RepID=UPI0025D6DC4B|nr:extracellular solute-binding protein [Treponema sp.]MBR4321253.1 extracellular solute-binding protein [Treponema sp.]